ncbi:MAG: diguanylate cyclase, partial [Planctomycetes bacterium]|nr:diguanylate cyclase [Planctomycetota bacterium]
MAAVLAVAAVGWWRRDAGSPIETRTRLALAWGLCGGSLSLLPGAVALPILPAALCLLLVAGSLPLCSRTALLALHAAMVSVPGVVALALANRWLEATLVALAAAVTPCVALRVRRLQVAAALADIARDEAEQLAAALGTALAQSAATCDHLLDDDEHLVVVVDARGRIERLNLLAREQIGAVPGERFRDAVPLVEPQSRRRARDAVAECQRDGIDVRVEHAILLVPGVAREFEVSVRARPLAGGRVVVTLRDDTEVRTLQRLQLLREGRDPVTGLLNRRELEQRFHRLRNGPGMTHSLCCIEVEQVDLVNEACGYPAGDALLHQVALQMAATARAEDCLARLGGGQFALLLPDCDASTARAVAAKLLDSVSATPFPWRDQRFALTGRAGISTFTGALVPLPEVLGEAVAAC